MDEPFRFIGAVQVGITIFSILVGAIGESLITDYFDPYMPHTVAFIISFSLLTYLTSSSASSFPKTVTLQMAEQMARLLAPPLSWFSVVFGPRHLADGHLGEGGHEAVRVRRPRPGS